MKRVNVLDLNRFELQNAVIQNLAADPSTPANGQVWMNTAIAGATVFKFYNGTSVQTLGTSSAAGTVTAVTVVTANGVSATVANQGTTPALTVTLGAITPSSVAATGTVTGSNLSGTNTGDQTITLTGNVTGSGVGSFATTIASGAVTNAMLAGSIAYAKLTLTGSVVNADLASGIDAAKIGGGAVSNTVFGYLSGVTSSIQTQINGLVGGLKYQGTWNASTNTPTLTGGAGTTGALYKVAVAGNTALDGNTGWQVGDNLLFDGTTWDKIDNTDAVSTVAGRTGAVVLTTADVGLGNVENTALSTWAGSANVTTLGTVATGTWSATAVAVAKGGTGATTATGARANIGAMGKYSALIGDGSTLNYPITQATHGLAADGTNSAAVYDATSGEEVGIDVNCNPANGTVTLKFGTAPTTNQYRVVITG